MNDENKIVKSHMLDKNNQVVALWECDESTFKELGMNEFIINPINMTKDDYIDIQIGDVFKNGTYWRNGELLPELKS